jgi:DNA gyrase subunit A
LLAWLVTTTRSTLGAITETGVLHSFHASDLPELDTAKPRWSEGISLAEYLGLPSGDGAVRAVIRLDTDVPVMLGTQRGVVKRFVPSDLSDKPHQPVIALKEGDRVAGAAVASDDDHIVFITSSGQLLTYSAGDVRPQGAGASGVAGISLGAEATVIAATAARRDLATVVTISGSSVQLPGTESARVKLTPLAEFPTKGRGTSGVRAHSFLKGEDLLRTAFVGLNPRAMGSRGQAVALPEERTKRDGSGSVLEGSVSALGDQPA